MTNLTFSVTRYRYAVHGVSNRDCVWLDRGTSASRRLELHLTSDRLSVTRGTQPIEVSLLSEVGVVARDCRVLFVLSNAEASNRRFYVEFATVQDANKCVDIIQSRTLKFEISSYPTEQRDRAMRRCSSLSNKEVGPHSIRYHPRAKKERSVSRMESEQINSSSSMRNHLRKISLEKAVEQAYGIIKETDIIKGSVVEIESCQLENYMEQCLNDVDFVNFTCNLYQSLNKE